MTVTGSSVLTACVDRCSAGGGGSAPGPLGGGQTNLIVNLLDVTACMRMRLRDKLLQLQKKKKKRSHSHTSFHVLGYHMTLGVVVVTGAVWKQSQCFPINAFHPPHPQWRGDALTGRRGGDKYPPSWVSEAGWLWVHKAVSGILVKGFERRGGGGH